jgi:hypothetical protein
VRALFIDASRPFVVPVDIPPVGDGSTAAIQQQLTMLQTLVGGSLEFAYRFPNGDVLLVDESGKLKEPRFFFWIEGAPEPYAERGVIVGREDHEGDITPALATVDEVEAKLRFSLGVTL